VDWGEDSPVEAYVADFSERVAAAKQARVKFGKRGYETEDLTMLNPAYWRAVYAMGEDRILLFWLHGLLLEAEKRPKEAFEWTVLARRGVQLSEEFDTCWLQWEEDLLVRTEAGHPYRNPALWMKRDRVQSQMTVLPSGVVWVPSHPEMRGGGRVHYNANNSQPILSWYSPALFRASQLQQEGELADDLAEVLSSRPDDWPYLSVLAADELRILAGWFKSQRLVGLEAMFRFLAYGQDGHDQADLARHLAPRLGVPAAEVVWPSSPHGRLGLCTRPPLTDAQEKVHPLLLWDARQELRRLDGIKRLLSHWMISEAYYHNTRAELYWILRESQLMKSAVSASLRASRNAAWGHYWLTRYGLRLTDGAALEEHIKRLEKRDPSHTEFPSLHAEVAMWQGRWGDAAADYRVVVKDNNDMLERRAFAAFHAYVAASMQGCVDPKLETWEFETDAELEWVGHLHAALQGELDRKALLAEAQMHTAFVTAGRLAEAHLALAFAPDATTDTRRADLEAVLATGRVDFVEYGIARYALRDLAKTNPAE
jgi:hypothetical protein